MYGLLMTMVVLVLTVGQLLQATDVQEILQRTKRATPSCTTLSECINLCEEDVSLPRERRCLPQCVALPDGVTHECACSQGYIFNAEGTACIDVNECSNPGQTALCTCGDLKSCASNCINTPGSFDCSCSDGFELASDSRTCIQRVQITGNEIRASSSGVDTSAIFLLRPAFKKEAVLFALRGYFRSTTPFLLQVWRPYKGSNGFRLVWEQRVTPKVQSAGQEDVYLQSCVRVYQGDRIGYYLTASPGALAYVFSTGDPSVLAHYPKDDLEDEEAIRVGNTISFSQIVFPYTFSLAVYSDTDIGRYSSLSKEPECHSPQLMIPGTDLPITNTTMTTTTTTTTTNPSEPTKAETLATGTETSYETTESIQIVPDEKDGKLGLILGVIFGVVILVVLIAAFLAYLLWFRRRNKSKSTTQGIKNPVYSEGTEVPSSPASDPTNVIPDTAVYVNVDYNRPSDYQVLQKEPQSPTKHVYSPLDQIIIGQEISQSAREPQEDFYVNESAPELTEQTYENESTETGQQDVEDQTVYENEGNPELDTVVNNRTNDSEVRSPDVYEYVENRFEHAVRGSATTPSVLGASAASQYAERVPDPDTESQPQTPALYENVHFPSGLPKTEGSGQGTDQQDYLVVT